MIALNGRGAPEDPFGRFEQNRLGFKWWRDVIDVTHARSTIDAYRIDDLHCALTIPVPFWFVRLWLRVRYWR